MGLKEDVRRFVKWGFAEEHKNLGSALASLIPSPQPRTYPAPALLPPTTSVEPRFVPERWRPPPQPEHPIAALRRQLEEAHREIEQLPLDPQIIDGLHNEVDKAFLQKLKKKLNGK